HRVAMLRTHKYLVLLPILVGISIVQSFGHPIVVVSQGLGPLAILAVSFVVFAGRRERMAALGLAAAVIAVNWSQFLPIPEAYRTGQALVYEGLRLLFPGLAVAVILRNIFGEEVITRDQVLGAVCGYLLAAAMWTHVYALVELLLPGSFGAV